MRPAPRFEIAACFLGGRSGVNFNLPFFNRNNGTVTITCRVHRQQNYSIVSIKPKTEQKTEKQTLILKMYAS